jgi:RNA polymerase sporulation-specific sigma factor
MNKILSDLEWEVFMSYLEGKSYQETAQELHRHIKSIDNALQRVKRKVERYRETCAADMDIQAVCKSLMAVGRQRKVVTKSSKKAKK